MAILTDLDHVRMAPPTIPVSDEITGTVRDLLVGISDEIDTRTFAITDLERRGEWYLVSVIGLVDIEDPAAWNLQDHSQWFGLAILTQDERGNWRGSVEGAEDFGEYLAAISPDVLSPAAVSELSGDVQIQSTGYVFPWEPGYSMQYGGLGVHAAGFAGVVPNWKAVDFLSDGRTDLGRAPNRLLAASSGSITYICRGPLNVAIRIGDLLYVHLLDNANLTHGRYFSQGQLLGQLKSGSFQDNCGWASQQAGWFHVHWGFPNVSPFRAGGWELNLTDGIWRRGGQARGTYSWFLADPPLPPPPPPPSQPVLSSPASGTVFGEGQGITLAWSATGDEYDGEISGGPGGTQTFTQSGTSRAIGAQPAGYAYSWRVRARNGSGTSGWCSPWTFIVRPHAPTNLSAQVTACNRVNLNWTDNSASEEGYRIYRNGSLLALAGANVTGYTDASVSRSTIYSYSVRAYRGEIESISNPAAIISTPPCISSDPPQPTIPRVSLPIVQR
jgi:hypothetical protein